MRSFDNRRSDLGPSIAQDDFRGTDGHLWRMFLKLDNEHRAFAAIVPAEESGHVRFVEDSFLHQARKHP
jgi:hypothetical protein